MASNEPMYAFYKGGRGGRMALTNFAFSKELFPHGPWREAAKGDHVLPKDSGLDLQCCYELVFTTHIVNKILHERINHVGFICLWRGVKFECG